MNRREFVVAGSLTLATLAISTSAQEKKQYVCPPCGCNNDGTPHDQPGNCPACNMVLIEKTAGEREETKVKELGMGYFNIPVDGGSPDELDADDFLKLTDEQLKNGPVFIHCAAGTRVGAFWMIRRVMRDGWEFEKALEEANKIGLNNHPRLTEFAKDYIERKKKK
jgi:protein tyrosine phosphatase (PTP) superfamily phosphohydrolase (DUF442 family)